VNASLGPSSARPSSTRSVFSTRATRSRGWPTPTTRDRRQPERPAHPHLRPQQLQPPRDHHQAVPGCGHRHLPRGPHAFRWARTSTTTRSSTSPRILRRELHLRLAGQLRGGVPSGAGESFQQNFPGSAPRGPRPIPTSRRWPSSSGRVEGAQGADPDPRLRYDLAVLRQAPGPEPGPAAGGSGDRHQLPEDGPEQLRPRLGLAWSPNAKTWCAPVRTLLRPHPVHHGGDRALQQRGQRDLGAAHGGPGPDLSRRLVRAATGRGRGQASIFIFDPAYENPEVHQ